jgi:hypothetical protein
MLGVVDDDAFQILCPGSTGCQRRRCKKRGGKRKCAGKAIKENFHDALHGKFTSVSVGDGSPYIFLDWIFQVSGAWLRSQILDVVYHL